VAVRRFERRFAAVEAAAGAAGREVKQLSADEMLQAWRDAKAVDA
jgi:uncharacterized protein YabN with tetrapyrrole methylase and pyrophosphatase domain